MGLSHVESCVIGSLSIQSAVCPDGIWDPYRVRVELGAKKWNWAVRGLWGGRGEMGREPPPRRNDAALLSKIASQEKRYGGLLYMYTYTIVPFYNVGESIRWLQKSGREFYVKILQKIMAWYRWFVVRLAGRFVHGSRLPLPNYHGRCILLIVRLLSIRYQSKNRQEEQRCKAQSFINLDLSLTEELYTFSILLFCFVDVITYIKVKLKYLVLRTTSIFFRFILF